MNARRPHQNSAASSKENADAAISTSPKNEKTPDTAGRKPEGYTWAVCSTHRSALYSQPKATAHENGAKIAPATRQAPTLASLFATRRG